MSQHLRTSAALAVVTVVLAGCGASPSSPQAGQSTAAQPSTGGSHSVGPGGSRHHHASPAPRHTSTAKSAKNGPTHSSAAGSSAAPTAKATVSTGHPTAAPATRTGPAPIAAGTYTYRQTGSQKVAGFTTKADPTSTLTVEPATANGKQVSHRQSGNQPPSDQTLLFTRKGMFLLSMVERAAYGGHTETISCTFHPGVPYPPWPVTVGAKVHAHADCGQVSVTATGRVTGRRTTTVGGQSLAVYVIKITLTTSGQVTSTSTDTEWFSPALRLSVHDVNTINGKLGPFAFSGTVTQTLTSTTPH